MVSVLLVSPRQGDEVVKDEFRDVSRATGIKAPQLRHHVLDSAETADMNLMGIDGVIVGGSPLHITQEEPEELRAWQARVHEEFDRLIAHPVPTIFLCYGTGYAAQYHGGTVGRSHPEQPGTTLVRLTDHGRRDPITRGLPLEFSALTGHTENVVAVGESTRILATGPSCPVQMLRANESTWACQFHPDLDVPSLAQRMSFYTNHGYFDPEDYHAIVDSLSGVNTEFSNRILANFVAYCAEAADTPKNQEEHVLSSAR